MLMMIIDDDDNDDDDTDLQQIKPYATNTDSILTLIQ